MNPAVYVRALRRRWVDVGLAVAIGLVVGWTVPTVSPPGPPERSFEASAVLFSPTDPLLTAPTNLRTLAALANVGEVPRRVADEVGFEGDPAVLAQLVEATANEEAGILRITATMSDGPRAAEIADAFAEQLVAFLGEQTASSTAEQARALREELDQLEREIRDLDRRITGAPGSQRGILQAQRSAKIADYQLLYQTYQQVARGAIGGQTLQVVQSATPIPVETGGLEPPTSRGGWVLLGGILGLVSGVVLVLVLDRYDSRIRTRQEAERHFGYPVLAEIPFAPRWKRDESAITTVAQPKSPTADAFRILAATLAMPRPLLGAGSVADGDGPGGDAPGGDGRGNGGMGGAMRAPKTILVTSPGPADGKTTVVANLAAALAGREASTLVLSCDFRRATLHRLFGVSNEPGLAEALRTSDGEPVLAGLTLETGVPGVRVVPSGPYPNQPAELLSSPAMTRALAEARNRSDFVLVDTAPILTTSDAASLLSQVDAVVVVARAGRTTAEVAERTSELLKRLGAPVVGVVLSAAAEITVPSRFYYYRYYYGSAEKRGHRGFPRLARPAGKRETPGW